MTRRPRRMSYAMAGALMGVLVAVMFGAVVVAVVAMLNANHGATLILLTLAFFAGVGALIASIHR